MYTPSVPAVRAIFLASNLAQGRLTGWACLVNHPVFELVSSHSASDDGNLLVWQSDGLAASWSNATAHRLLALHHPSRFVQSIPQDQGLAIQSYGALNLDASVA